jgi:hypothetical protein
MSGLSGKVTIRGSVACFDWSYSSSGSPVLVAPHDALGEPRRAAGVDDVDVVRAALLEVALGALPRHRLLERHAAERRDVVLIRLVDHVGQGDEGLQPGVLRGALRDQVGVAAIEEKRHDVGVVEEVVELALDVAVVDVDGRRAQLDGGQHRDDVLDAVLRVDRHVVTGLHPPPGQVVRQPVAVALQVGVRRDPVPDLDGEVVRGRVDGVLEEVCDVQRHVRKTRTRSRFGLRSPRDQHGC